MVAIEARGAALLDETMQQFAATPEIKKLAEEALTCFLHRSNGRRDQKNIQALLAFGWRVIILWECGLRRKKPNFFESLGKTIRSNTTQNIIEFSAIDERRSIS
jgi:G:T-mismatch repair DNA endonuclease (very short patch repair protein)